MEFVYLILKALVIFGSIALFGGMILGSKMAQDYFWNQED